MVGATGDAATLDAARAGDVRAFSALMTPHRNRLWGVCLRITGNGTDAEDALQNAMLSIWRSLPRFRGESALSTYIYRIAANAALAVVRSRRYDVSMDETFDLPDRRTGPDDAVAIRLDMQAVLMAMSEDFRVALVLREYGAFTYEEIAEYQSVSLQTVKSRIFRARALVRNAFVD